MSRKEQFTDQLIDDLEKSLYNDHEDNFIDCVFVPDADCDD